MGFSSAPVRALFCTAVFLAPTAAWAQEGVVLNRNHQAEAAKPPPMAPASTLPPAILATPETSQIPLSRVVIDGAAPTTAASLAWQPYVGRMLNADTLHGVADAVAKAYGKTAALYTVVLPSQDFRDGVLHLRVTEGHFENVVIHGAVKNRDMSLIRAYAARMAAERPLSRRTLERYISLIRDIPGLKPDIQLLQGATLGGVKLAIGVTEKTFSWGVGVDNRGSALLDQQELEADIGWNSLLRQGDQTRLTVASSADFKSAEAVALTHSEPLGTDGAKLDLTGEWLRTRAAGIALRGQATALGAQLSYPVIRSYRDNLYLTAGLDGLDSDNAILGQTLSSERTRSLRAGAVFSRSRPKSSLSLSLVASLGIDGLGARVDPLLADSNYGKIAARIAYDRKLGRTVTLRLRGAAQDAGQAWLPTSEMFALGGDLYGRGFATALLLGDSGTAGSAEIGWTPNGLPGFIAGSEIYTFADAGQIDRGARPGLSRVSDSLSSAGGGVRLALKKTYVVGLEAAQPIDTPIGVGRNWRCSFSLRSRF